MTTTTSKKILITSEVKVPTPVRHYLGNLGIGFASSPSKLTSMFLTRSQELKEIMIVETEGTPDALKGLTNACGKAGYKIFNEGDTIPQDGTPASSNEKILAICEELVLSQPVKDVLTLKGVQFFKKASTATALFLNRKAEKPSLLVIETINDNEGNLALERTARKAGYSVEYNFSA